MRVAIVHYHLDPGGVTRVIEATSQILTQQGIHHVILTGSLGQAQLPARLVAGLAYGHLEDLTGHQLLAAMRLAAEEFLGDKPDVWHFHNHSLGKNPLIAEVVAQLADDHEPLLLQLHDLAENGRPQNLPLIANSRNLYPVSPRVHYVFLNSRDREVFTNAGLPEKSSALLGNPIPFPAVPATCPVVGPTIVFAPIRGIRRKNLGEIVFLSALAPAGTSFAISRAPKNPEALSIHENWRKFASRQRLPVAFDVVDHFSPVPAASADFDSWLVRSSHLVSTSVEEGFGLPFLEAIALGKPMFGRNLAHITADHARHGISCGNFYDRLLIPLEWIDLSIFEAHLNTTLERNFRNFDRPIRKIDQAEIMESMSQENLLDFGNLPESLQQGIIERMEDKACRAIPLAEAGDRRVPLVDWLAEILSNRQAASPPERLSDYSLENYGKRLVEIYQNLTAAPASHPGGISASAILDAHLAPGRFHFLMSVPPLPASSIKYRAVIFDIYGTLLIAPSGGVNADPLIDPVLREIIRNAGFHPPTSPSSELHAAMLRHHGASDARFPEIDLRTLWREILSLDRDQNVQELVIELEEGWHPSQWMPGAAQTIAWLARRSVSLGILSNAQCNTLPSLGSIADLFAPELTILSYQQGIAKPSPALFETIRERLQGRRILPEETLFIGNDPRHDILPAAAVGFQTALFTGHPDSWRPGDCHPTYLLKNWADLRALF